ncbi:unnamed protein product [Ixodes hexagonus]
MTTPYRTDGRRRVSSRFRSRRLVASSNFLVHSVHCQRNIVLCPECSSPVPKSNLEEHRVTHAPTRCPDCRCCVELQRLSEHRENECAKRLVTCEFCELSCASEAMPEHSEYCGSRTQECSGCGLLVLLRDKQHQCPPPGWSAYTTPSLSTVSPVCPKNSQKYNKYPKIPADELSSSVAFLSRKPLKGPSNDIYAPAFFALPAFSVVRQVQGTKAKPQKNISQHTVENPPRSAQRLKLLAMGPCEICEEPFPMEELHGHQLRCTLEPRRLAEREEEASLPCELCQQCFPVSALAHHQATCDLSPEEALLSDELYPAMAGGDQLLTGRQWAEGSRQHNTR